MSWFVIDSLKKLTQIKIVKAHEWSGKRNWANLMSFNFFFLISLIVRANHGNFSNKNLTSWSDGGCFVLTCCDCWTLGRSKRSIEVPLLMKDRMMMTLNPETSLDLGWPYLRLFDRLAPPEYNLYHKLFLFLSRPSIL